MRGDNDKAEKWRMEKGTCIIEGVYPLVNPPKDFSEGFGIFLVAICGNDKEAPFYSSIELDLIVCHCG
jgi:hypothetical protein